MKTISRVVSEMIDDVPFIQESLQAGILNYKSTAVYLKAYIEKAMQKEVKTGSIQMALMRYKLPSHITSSKLIMQSKTNLGSLNLTVDLCCYTYIKSKTLLKLQSSFLDKIEKQEASFFLFNHGYSECNITFSKSLEILLPKELSMESLIKKTDKLNAVTLKLPKESENIKGLYYILFKELAWNNVTLYDISSTANEITLIVKDVYVQATIASFKTLRF